VIGHSQGEIAAATVAGILTIDEGAKVVALRSQALSALAAPGGMISVVMHAAEVEALLESYAGRLSVAAVNGPAATVVSGDREALAAFEADLSARHVLRWPIPETDFVAHSARVEDLEPTLTAALAQLRPGPGQIPLYSTVYGRWMDGPSLDAGYWYANVRRTVQFGPAVRALAASGYRSFVEISPHPVLTGAVTETGEGAGVTAPVVTGTLARQDGGAARLLASLAAAHVAGVTVDWAAVLGGGQRVDLPTYAFQRQRYWPEPAAVRTGDLASVGLVPAGHPLIGAEVEVASGEGLLLFTGQLSLRAQPWLADHTVSGVVLLPGTAFLELAILAGRQAGCGRVDELIMAAPLVIPAQGGVRIQVSLAEPNETGIRPVEIYSRPEHTAAGTPWTRHASGLLAPAAPVPTSTAFTAWPPTDAVPVPVSGVYDLLAAAGLGYGPVFRGLRAAWRSGEDVYAEVALPAEAAIGAGVFGLHPALLDAALHTVAFTGADDGQERQPRMPFAWRGVSLWATGAAALRVRLRPVDNGLSLEVTDGAGAPVASVDSLVLRPVTGALPAAGGPGECLFTVNWVPVPAPVTTGSGAGRWAVIAAPDLAAGLAAMGADVRAHDNLTALITAITGGEIVPDLVLAPIGTQIGIPTGVQAGDESGPRPATGSLPPDLPAGDGELARRVAGEVLGLVQQWLAEELLASARLVLVTRGSAAAVPGDLVTDLAAAAACGLARSAQSENPGRLVLADLPADGAGDGTSLAGLMAALASGEPEVALRDGTVLGRRLTRLPAAVSPGPAIPRTSGTVLITGGTGTLGALTARHLAATRQPAALVLASRSGPAAPGAPALAAGLAQAGASVQVTACDAADRDQLAALLTRLPARLTGVIHTAGTLDDATIGSLTPARLDAVMRPKADAAWHLHQLTATADLDTFVLFSSAAATFGGAGQGNYAAANAYLDALAAHRQATGHPATTLAWGTWVQSQGIGRNLGEDQLGRVSRSGMIELSAEDGLAVFDQAISRDEALLVPTRLNMAVLRAGARNGMLPAVLHGLVPVSRPENEAGQALSAPAWRERLSRAGQAEQGRLIIDLVRTEAAAVLGHETPEMVEAELSFLEQGLDSLTAVEFRNRLNAATGLRLSGSVAFDYPTPVALARQLHEELSTSSLLPKDDDSAASGEGDPGNYRYVISADIAPTDNGAPTHSLGRLYVKAVNEGRADEMMKLIIGLASFRPSFTGISDLEHIPPPLPVSRGPEMAGMICFPSFFGRSGAREYARFARGFHGIRKVSVIPDPGFAEGEPLPATLDALISVQAENVRRSVDGTPFVLAGHSTGGLIAHALAVRLKTSGLPPAGVVLIDTYPPEKRDLSEKHRSRLLDAATPGTHSQGEDSGADAWLTAMAHYSSLDWQALDETDIPTLLVRAENTLAGSADNQESKTSWAFSTRVDVIDVPGDHFTMMSDYADTTARTVNEWLTELCRNPE
jgi:polyketide synthase 12